MCERVHARAHTHTYASVCVHVIMFMDFTHVNLCSFWPMLDTHTCCRQHTEYLHRPRAREAPGELFLAFRGILASVQCCLCRRSWCQPGLTRASMSCSHVARVRLQTWPALFVFAVCLTLYPREAESRLSFRVAWYLSAGSSEPAFPAPVANTPFSADASAMAVHYTETRAREIMVECLKSYDIAQQELLH